MLSLLLVKDEDGVEVVAGDDGVAARRVQRAAGHRGGYTSAILASIMC